MLQKNPDIKKEVTVEEPKLKGKRKHRETSCADKRRSYYSCGICGSENMVTHGVAYCTICGKELEFITIGDLSWYYSSSEIKYPKCVCRPEGIHSKYSKESVVECIDCGAVKARKCPACKRSMWYNQGKKYCKHCGFRELC